MGEFARASNHTLTIWKYSLVQSSDVRGSRLPLLLLLIIFMMCKFVYTCVEKDIRSQIK